MYQVENTLVETQNPIYGAYMDFEDTVELFLPVEINSVCTPDSVTEDIGPCDMQLVDGELVDVPNEFYSYLITARNEYYK